MPIIDLGKIKFTWQGEYDPAQTYEMDDVVGFNGSSYIATTAIDPNQSPENEDMGQGAWEKGAWELMTRGNKTTPFLRMGGYGGWATSSTYPGDTWNKLRCFENITMNRGGFIINSATQVTLPETGLYHVHCSAYAGSNDHVQTNIVVNGSSTVQGASTRTYWNGNGKTYAQHGWDDVAYLNAGDVVEFEFYQRTLNNSNYTIYHPHMHGSITYLGD